MVVNGQYYLHLRPGTDAILKVLLEEPCVSFAIASHVNSWYCLPAMRLCLEHVLPGTSWFVEETVEGDWTSYSDGCTFTISGSDVFISSDRWHLGEWNERYAHFDVGEDNRCSLVFADGREQRGRLTEDGLLVWQEGHHEWKWWRAGKTNPPCLACRENRSLRVHIFDRESVCEQIWRERDPSDEQQRDVHEDDQWIWFRK